ncbi:MAG TPA: hypothetical protein DEB46_02230 [Myxococcales bacterium]|nr:hypothetical protein [Myxococcales bacterium]
MRLVLTFSLMMIMLTAADCGGERVVCKDSDDRVVACEQDAGPIEIRWDAGPRPDAGARTDAGPERPYESPCDPNSEALCRLFECYETPDGWQENASEGYCTKPCASDAECGDVNLYRCREGGGGSLRCHRDRDQTAPELEWTGSNASLAAIGRNTELELLATDNRSIGALSVTVAGTPVVVESGEVTALGTMVQQRFSFTLEAAGDSLEIEASVQDGIGNTSSVLNRTVAVDTQAPQVMITRQPNQGLTDGGTIPGILGVQATASDNVGVLRVTYYLGDNAVGSSVEGPDWGVFMDACDFVGGGRSFELRAIAEDAAGNTGTDSFDVNVTNNGCSG